MTGPLSTRVSSAFLGRLHHAGMLSMVIRASRVPEECSSTIASLYDSCLQDDPGLRPAAADVVASLEREFGVRRAQSAPAPDVELDGSSNPNKLRAAVSAPPHPPRAPKRHP
jgi:hypothetical protein